MTRLMTATACLIAALGFALSSSAQEVVIGPPVVVYRQVVEAPMVVARGGFVVFLLFVGVLGYGFWQVIGARRSRVTRWKEGEAR